MSKKTKYVLLDSKVENFKYSLIGPGIEDVVFHTTDNLNEVIGRSVIHVLAGAVDYGVDACKSIELEIDIKGVSYRKFILTVK